jgi:hypothetical protein
MQIGAPKISQPWLATRAEAKEFAELACVGHISSAESSKYISAIKAQSPEKHCLYAT